jgi:hypothetical protein
MSATPDFQQFDRVEVIIKPRPLFQGRKVRPAIAAQEGKRVVLQVLWQAEDDEPYAGEWALGMGLATDDLIALMGASWIASGDVEYVKTLAPDSDEFDPPVKWSPKL